MTSTCDTVLNQARERTYQDTENTHAALAGGCSEGRYAPGDTLLFLADPHESTGTESVVERSTCAIDNNMHTGRTDGRRGGIAWD
jgi:hypothetical protein